MIDLTAGFRDSENVISDEGARLLQIANETLLAHFGELCDRALVVDREARIVWMSEPSPPRMGITAQSVVGMPVESLIPHSRMREIVETGQPILLDILDFEHESVVVSRLPLRDDTGCVIGAIGMILLHDALSLAPLVSRFNKLRRDASEAKNLLAVERRARYTLSSMFGDSERFLAIKQEARRAARSCASVLIQGETGTGKELLAQAIHNASLRADRPFVAVNIAAIPDTLLESEFFGVAPGAYTGAERKGREGKFKLADGGTLFLDEIGDMSAALQAKLLRVLQEGEFEALGSNRLERVDVRVVAATSRDLNADLAAGKFRPDLFYRLNVIPITMPPLRERISDFPELCDHMLESLCRKLSMPLREITPEAVRRLQKYNWPGNLRELQNVLERTLLMNDGDFIGFTEVDAVLPEIDGSVSEVTEVGRTLAESVAEAEKRAIQNALSAYAGNKARAATALGIARTTLYEKIAMLGLA